jgi:hypothetical protein
LILIITLLRKRLTGNSPLVIARSIIDALMPYMVLRPEMLVALTSAIFFKVRFSPFLIPSRAVRMPPRADTHSVRPDRLEIKGYLFTLQQLTSY